MKKNHFILLVLALSLLPATAYASSGDHTLENWLLLIGLLLCWLKG